MFDSYLIEVGNEIAGVVVRSGQGFRFHAVGSSFRELEDQRFASPWKAERAAAQLQRTLRRRAADSR